MAIENDHIKNKGSGLNFEARLWAVADKMRGRTIKAKARSPEMNRVIDDAMGAIESENPTLRGVLPRDYARPTIDKVRLGGLVDNGSMSSQTSNESEIRKALIEADLVDCMVVQPVLWN